VRRPISVVGAIHLLSKRDKSGGDFCFCESLGGGMGVGELGDWTERRGNWGAGELEEICEWEQ